MVRKATGNHLMNSTSLVKLRALSLVSATLETEYATQCHCFDGIQQVDQSKISTVELTSSE